VACTHGVELSLALPAVLPLMLMTADMRACDPTEVITLHPGHM